MVIETERSLAMRCPACGKLNHQVFSLFELSGSRTLKVHCNCGFTLLVIGTRDHKKYTLQTFCVVCEMTHITICSAKELWCQDQTELFCPDTGVELGLIGNRAIVREAIRKEQTPLQVLLQSSEYNEFFENGEVMTALQDLADQGRLYCQCGNANIDIDIYPERVELHCPECDGSLTVYGRTLEDAHLFNSISQIELMKDSLPGADGGKFKKRNS